MLRHTVCGSEVRFREITHIYRFPYRNRNGALSPGEEDSRSVERCDLYCEDPCDRAVTLEECVELPDNDFLWSATVYMLDDDQVKYAVGETEVRAPTRETAATLAIKEFDDDIPSGLGACAEVERLEEDENEENWEEEE